MGLACNGKIVRACARAHAHVLMHVSIVALSHFGVSVSRVYVCALVVIDARVSAIDVAFGLFDLSESHIS